MEQTKFKTVESIQFGANWLETWYFTPLPFEFHTKCLYICDFCLFFCVTKKEFKRHTIRCSVRHPPGDEIYRDNDISMFEVDGITQRIFCENLSLISRMFLEHKNVCESIEPFLFYVLCEVKPDGFHLVGYFSKEKKMDRKNNLSCIMVMPIFQRSGYGKLLIDFSYQLSILEGKPGGPERPLSDLGHKAYVPYWTRKVVELLLDLTSQDSEITIEQMSLRTGMIESDILYILRNQKILVGDSLNCNPKFLQSILQHTGRKPRHIYTNRIRWKPYNIINY